MTQRPWLAFYDQGVPKTLEYPQQTLSETLADMAKKFPHNPILYYFGTRINYSELNDKVNQFANLLIEEGIKPGDRVALYLPNCPAVVIAYYAVLRIGAILTQLNPLYSVRETAYQLKDSGAQYVISLDRFVPILRQVADECHLKKVWVTRVNDYFPIPLKWLYVLKAKKEKSWVAWPKEPLFHSFVEELNEASPEPVQLPLDLDKTALLQYTGGTTGVAKGVIMTHRNLA